MSFIKRIIKYLLLKFKWRSKLIFDYSNQITMTSCFEGTNKLERGVFFHGYMGRCSYIAEYSQISGKVGRYTSIAPYCKVIQGTHPYTYPFVSTCPMFYSTEKQNGQTFVLKNKYKELRFVEDKIPVIIGNDCWIGYGVSIIAGVNIGDGAMVMAHAVVTKNVPPYAIVAGIPARIIGYRYKDCDIDYLLKLQWWNKPIEWIKSNADFFEDIETFKLNNPL